MNARVTIAAAVPANAAPLHVNSCHVPPMVEYSTDQPKIAPNTGAVAPKGSEEMKKPPVKRLVIAALVLLTAAAVLVLVVGVRSPKTCEPGAAPGPRLGNVLVAGCP